MSESSLITLDIGGESDSAVSSINDVSDAFVDLNGSAQTAAGGADDAATGLDQAGGAATSAGGGATDAAEGFDVAGKGLISAAQAGLGASSALKPLNEIFGELKSGSKELGEGGFAALGAGAAIGVTSIVALAMAGKEWANETMRLTAVTGMSQDETETWSHAMSIAGGDANSLQRAVLTLSKDIESGMPSVAAAEYQKLGISFRTTGGEAKSASELFQETVPAIAGMTSASEQQNAVTAIWGARFGGQLLPLIQNYNSIMPAATGITEQHAQGMGNAAQKAIEYNTSQEKLKGSIQEIGATTLPLVSEALGHASDVVGVNAMFVTGLSKEWGSAKDAAGSFVGGIGDVIGGLGGLVGSLGGSSGGLDKHTTLMQANYTTGKDLGSMMGLLSTDIEGFSSAEEGATGTVHALTAAQEAQIKAMDMSRMGFENSVAGIEHYQEAMQALIQVTGNEADAQMQLQSIMGNNISISSSGQMTLTPRATGGPVKAGEAYVVGDAGVPELFVSQSDGYIYPGGGSSGVSSGSGASSNGRGITVIINQNGDVYGFDDFKSKVLDFVRNDAQVGAALRGYGNF